MTITAVLLCAGYGTRLEKDLQKDASGSYRHLIGIPKPLLPIHSKPLIRYWFDKFEAVMELSKAVIVCNQLHKVHYEEFVKELDGSRVVIQIVSDGSSNNETRSGAVSCMRMGCMETSQDILFIAGDTLFDENFKLHEMFARFESLKRKSENVVLIVSAPVEVADMSKHGIIEVNSDGEVISFLEKPQPHETTSRLQSPCCYLFSNRVIPFLDEFLIAKKDEPLSKKDATGNFIQYLLSKVPVFAFAVSQRYDIGNLKSYIDCCSHFGNFSDSG